MAKPMSTAAARLIVDGVAPRLDRRITASREPYTGTPAMRPHVGANRWAWTHYGVFIPSLPAPHRFLNVMTLIGATGTELFDNTVSANASADARLATTVLSSTAHAAQHHYAGYDAAADGSFADDGSSLRWATDLAVERSGNRVSVAGRYDTFEIELDLSLTDQVSYFTHTPVYQHLSLLAPYRGAITDLVDDTTTTISGLGTVEYARCAGPQSLLRRPVGRLLRLPVDFFTYQIIQLDEVTQLLLTDVTARGAVAARTVHVRTVGGRADVFEDVTCDVELAAVPRLDPDGNAMRVPAGFTWIARRDGREVLRLECHVDDTLRYGHGNGYVGSYDYSGTYDGREVSGIGYLEWIDMRVTD
ncbi:DUF6670 family protein [Gordonia crocea]|uniref:AttH domain-containing protein n=1 Tax=Gordonia crocea TaxID=589162 RepID=A0A7I9V1G7_9ACTN|nr:DUF6670 family protein [Gordonia crocea]GED98670.1 hypothetical protein nbrc107697_27090 [Gordonia crocea]GED99284.1 hypothetical protein nbrc107697_33230 [Gordonia crocea]